MSSAAASRDESAAAALHRRRFLEGLAGVAGLAAVATLPADRAAASPRPPSDSYPFSLGVASGDPLPNGIVLWTRLAPEPFKRSGGMPDTEVGVDWVLAADPALRSVVRTGRALAMPELAHSVHVELDGLEPDQEYYYRFRYRGEVSPVGRTRTAPAPGTNLRRLDFAFVSSQAWQDGY